MHTARKKLEELRRRIEEKENLLVAFSGGVDSGFLLTVAHEVLGEKVMAVTIDSELFPRRELEHVKSFLNHMGIKYKIFQFLWQRNGDFVRNPYNRCYICKKYFSQILNEVAAAAGITTIAEGVTASDLAKHRPGIAASKEAGVWHPLVEVDMKKTEIRQIAKEIGLTFWDKPPNPCLATRIAYEEKITVEKLKMIEKAEDYLKDVGFRQVRVRLHRGGIARIEVGKEEIEGFFDTKMLADICGKLKTLGFNYVTLDLEGYRTGSMN
ncbi:MAG: ATP-dependent sacrificial sulfur transferase LarE [Methanophagales archaeon]|nr:ATP-dependent sacrificial sulfur transferase LarE [Methanophagales archaeon]MCW3141684.1 ATP-dependent sacrificial sulfur transferase LarE [Methanophagales archaeon]